VQFVTSSGPNSLYIAEKEFTLEPCKCDLRVSLEVLPHRRPSPGSPCLTPGDYIVKVTNPTGNNIDYSWSVNGIPNNSQNNATFNFSIAAGEEKTISVIVKQGGCEGSEAE
jgi:hypothetical protein